MADETAEEKAKREAEEKAKREAEEATAVEAKAAEDAEAERKAKEKKPVTLESINERIDELCARFDYFAELVLDSEAIDEVVEIEPPAPPAEEHHEAPATPAEGVKETVSAEHERPRRHKLT